MLYTITAQPLAAALRRAAAQGVCRPLLLPGVVPAPIVHFHADDACLHVRGPADAAAAVDGPVADFCGATNAVLSLGKCKGMMFGDQSTLDPDTRVCSVCRVHFPPPEDPVRHLGIHMSRDTEAARTVTFSRLHARVRDAAARWAQHRMSWLGRAHVAKQVLTAMVGVPRHLHAPAEGVVAAHPAHHLRLHRRRHAGRRAGRRRLAPCPPRGSAALGGGRRAAG